MALGTSGKLSKWILMVLNSGFLLAGVAAWLYLGLGFNRNNNQGLTCLRWSGGTGGSADAATTTVILSPSFLSALGLAWPCYVVYGDLSTHRENRLGLGVYALTLAVLAASLAATWDQIYTSCNAVFHPDATPLELSGVYLGTMTAVVAAMVCAVVLMISIPKDQEKGSGVSVAVAQG